MIQVLKWVFYFGIKYDQTYNIIKSKNLNYEFITNFGVWRIWKVNFTFDQSIATTF